MIEMPVLIIKKNVIAQKGPLFLIVRIKIRKSDPNFLFYKKERSFKIKNRNLSKKVLLKNYK